MSFIKGGMSSYTPSTHPGQYSRVDLVEDSNYYEPVAATIGHNHVRDLWPDVELDFDSSFHTTGGRYTLRYLGSVQGENSRVSDTGHNADQITLDSGVRDARQSVAT